MQRRIRKRYAAERRFRLLGLGAVLLSAGVPRLPAGHDDRRTASRGFTADRGRAADRFPGAGADGRPGALDGAGARSALAGAGLAGVVAAAADEALGADGAALISDGAWLTVRDAIKADPALLDGTSTI